MGVGRETPIHTHARARAREGGREGEGRRGEGRRGREGEGRMWNGCRMCV